MPKAAKSVSEGVHPDLLKVFDGADCRITEGVRTMERQKELYSKGLTKTLKSRHLTGHAVDVVIIRDGKAVWDVDEYAKLADEIKASAVKCGVRVTWGGVWDKCLNDFSLPSKDELSLYKKRKKSAFIDAVHFELDKQTYL